MSVIAVTTDSTVVIHEIIFDGRTVYAAGYANDPEPDPRVPGCMVGFFLTPGWSIRDGEALHANIWFEKSKGRPRSEYFAPQWVSVMQ